MNIRKSKLSTIVILGLLVSYVVPGFCRAQEFSRKGKFEFSGIFRGGDSIIAENVDYGVKVKINGGPNTGGFGFGYNFNENLNLNTNLLFGSTDIEQSTLSGSLITEGDIDIMLWNLNLNYNLMKDSFTPFVSGGIGSINFDGEYDTGRAFDETDFTWNLGGGLRWDVSEKWFLKGMYTNTWTELEDADDTSRIWSVNLSLGYKF